MRNRLLLPLALAVALSGCDVRNTRNLRAVKPVTDETKSVPGAEDAPAEPPVEPAKPDGAAASQPTKEAQPAPMPPPPQQPQPAEKTPEPVQSAGAGEKAAALLELSQEFLDNGDRKQAKFWLDHLTKEFPDTPAARQAAELLKGLK